MTLKWTVAVSVTKNKTFKIVFQKGSSTFDVDYVLNDSVIANKWYHKIKHLQHVPMDPVESTNKHLDLESIYEQFVDFANISPIDIDFNNITQKDLNLLHQVYENEHDRLSKRRDSSILYQFHHAIHGKEKTGYKKNRKYVGWGVKEGLLNELFKCNPHFDTHIQKNFVYANEAELGKTPYQYWSNGEPNEKDRVLQLCKPHMTLRARFFIAIEDQFPLDFDRNFDTWFSQYKADWLALHGLSEWRPIDEQSAPLLATTTCKVDLSQYDVKRIVLT